MGAAQELCDKGFARRLQHVCDLPQQLLCILPVLDDVRLKKLYYERLGGYVSGLKDRESLIREICKVLLNTDSVKSSDRSVDRKRSVQTFLGQDGNVSSMYSSAILDILGLSSSKKPRTSTSSASPTSKKSSPLIISITDQIERAFHRLEILFFASSGYLPEDAAALMMCDLKVFFRSSTLREQGDSSETKTSVTETDLSLLEEAVKLSDELVVPTSPLLPSSLLICLPPFVSSSSLLSSPKLIFI
eukprot:753154-Hanusia_phi.AAC.6